MCIHTHKYLQAHALKQILPTPSPPPFTRTHTHTRTTCTYTHVHAHIPIVWVRACPARAWRQSRLLDKLRSHGRRLWTQSRNLLLPILNPSLFFFLFPFFKATCKTSERCHCHLFSHVLIIVYIVPRPPKVQFTTPHIMHHIMPHILPHMTHHHITSYYMTLHHLISYNTSYFTAPQSIPL